MRGGGEVEGEKVINFSFIFIVIKRSLNENFVVILK